MKKVTKIKGNSHQQLSKKKLRVAAYCRVSTDSDAQLESLEAQKAIMKIIFQAVRIGSLQDYTMMKGSPA